MADAEIFNTLITAAGGSGTALGLGYLYIKGQLSDMRTEIERLRKEREDCATKCERRLDDGNKEFKAIITGINDIKIQIAKLEGKNELAREIAKELASIRRKGDLDMEMEFK